MNIPLSDMLFLMMRYIYLFLGIFLASLAFPESPKNSKPYYYDKDTSDFFTYGEWLYWQPVSQSPLNWTVVIDSYNDTRSRIVVTRQEADTKSLSFPFNSGYRVGAGYRFRKDTLDQNIRPWQIYGEYAHFTSSKSSGIESEGILGSAPIAVSQLQESLVPTDVSVNLYTLTSTHIDFLYNRADLGFAWPMWFKSNVIFRLIMGASGAWIRTNWESSFSQPASVFFDQVNGANLKWHWWGGGGFGKADIYLPFGHGFGLFANGGFSLFFGRMTEKEQYPVIDLALVISDKTTVYHFESFQPVVQFGLGIDFKRWIRNSALVYFSAGWEANWWFWLNQFGRINQRQSFIPSPLLFFDTAPTDLLIQGLTARAGLEF